MIMAEKPFFKVEELLCKQDVEKIKLFLATLGIDGEQTKISKGRKDLNYIIIKVLEGKLDEEGKPNEEKFNVFEHMIQNLSSTMGIMKQHKLIRKKVGRKLLLVLIAMLIMMVKVIIFHASYVS